MTLHRLDSLAWPDVRVRARADVILAVPVGSTEQHGPHLPLSVDTDVAVALCNGLASLRSDVLVAPAVAYGSSGEHAGFAGTLSIGQQATELVLLELGRSATETFKHVLFVSAHGGNAGPVRRAVDKLCAEGRDVSMFSPSWQGDAHAGRVETSMQLALRPHTVRSKGVRGNTRPLAELLPALIKGGVRAVSRTGILGDASGATAEEGQQLLDSLTDRLDAHVAEWREKAS